VTPRLALRTIACAYGPIQTFGPHAVFNPARSDPVRGTTSSAVYPNRAANLR
jgi:hypothetical protein